MNAHRKRQYGRQVGASTPSLSGLNVPFQPRRIAQWPGIDDSLRRWKVKELGQSRVPPGYKMQGPMAKVPLNHKSHKATQDIVERKMIREMNQETAGPRLDFLKDRYDQWVANGRPVYGDPGPNSRPNDFRYTNRAGGAWMDDVTDDDPKRLRKVDLRDRLER